MAYIKEEFSCLIILDFIVSYIPRSDVYSTVVVTTKHSHGVSRFEAVRFIINLYTHVVY